MKLANYNSTAVAATAPNVATPAEYLQLEKKLAGGVLWTLAGTAVSRGAVFVASILLARLLGRTTFGEYGAIDSTIGMFAVLSNLGLALATTKFLAKYRYADPEKAGRILALSCYFALAAGAVVSIVLAVTAPSLAAHSFDAPHLTIDLRIAAIVLLFSALNGTLTGALTGLHAFRALAHINLALGLVSIPILVGGALVAGLHGAVAALAITQLVSCLFQVAALRRITNEHRIPLAWSNCWRERASVLNVSVPALVSSSLNAPVTWLCIMLLVNFGGGYSQLGLLQVVNTWFLALLFLPGQLGLVYFPMFESLFTEGRSSEVVRLMWKLVAMNLVLFGAAAAGLTLFAGQILQCYGPQYADARPALIATVWTAVLVAIEQPLCTLVIAKSRMWQIAYCSVIWATVSISLTYELLDWGATGVAMARLAAYGCYGILIGWLALRSLSPAKGCSVTSQPLAVAESW